MIALEEHNFEAKVKVTNAIPEFDDIPNSDSIKSRLLGKPHEKSLALAAFSIGHRA